MDEIHSDNPGEKRFSQYEAFHLRFARIAVLYALLAFGNGLLYWQGSPLEVLGFTDDPIGWWAMAAVLFTVAFYVLAVKIAHQQRLHSANPNHQQHSLRRFTALLVALAILFALPNVFIAFLHFNGIQAGMSYWGEVREAYEVPLFHLLPMLLSLYWWLSLRR